MLPQTNDNSWVENIYTEDFSVSLFVCHGDCWTVRVVWAARAAKSAGAAGAGRSGCPRSTARRAEGQGDLYIRLCKQARRAAGGIKRIYLDSLAALAAAEEKRKKAHTRTRTRRGTGRASADRANVPNAPSASRSTRSPAAASNRDGSPCDMAMCPPIGSPARHCIRPSASKRCAERRSAPRDLDGMR